MTTHVNPFTAPSAELQKERLPVNNPHRLWKQITGLTIASLLFAWTGNYLNLILMTLTFLDAWTAGLYKDDAKKTFLNNSPVVWAIAMGWLTLIIYPIYIINRHKLKKLPGKNLYFVSVIAMGGFILATGLIWRLNLIFHWF